MYYHYKYLHVVNNQTYYHGLQIKTRIKGARPSLVFRRSTHLAIYSIIMNTWLLSVYLGLACLTCGSLAQGDKPIFTPKTWLKTVKELDTDKYLGRWFQVYMSDIFRRSVLRMRRIRPLILQKIRPSISSIGNGVIRICSLGNHHFAATFLVVLIN